MRNRFIAAAVLATISSFSHADIVGFGGDGTGYSLNGGANVTGNVLQLTDGGGSEARSAYFNTLQSYGNGFTANFTYQSNGGADGTAFVIQNDSRGASAVGGSGGSVGYGPENGTIVQPSAALILNLYGGSSSSFHTNGTIGANTSTGPVDLGSGTPVNVSLSYNPANYTVTQTLTQNGNTFTKSFPAILSGTVGNAGNAYVGFSGGTGGVTSTQTVSNFTYTSAAITAAPIVLRDSFSAPDNTLLSDHTPEVGGKWNVPLPGGNPGPISIVGKSVDTTGSARFATTAFSSALGAGQKLLVTLHESNLANFFGHIAGFDLLAAGQTKIFFGSPNGTNNWSIATDNNGSNTLQSSNNTQDADISLLYTYDTGDVQLFVNDNLVTSGTLASGLAIDSFGFENNNGGDVKFSNLQAALISVPEPGTLSLIAIGMASMLRRNRR